jgi:NAD(P)-dependent dehydrogenase (short-subunit alcohol dehydrogenase family)
MQRADRPLTVVTGGSRGIGAAIVLQLARDGHDVAIGYRTNADAAERVRNMAIEAGAQCVAIETDVTHEQDVERLFASAGQLGVVTGLVNNAGLTGHLGDLADTPVETIRQVIDINFTAVVLCARRAVQVMSQKRGGRGGAIVNISSAAATIGSPHEYVHYAAAKAAVDTLTVGLAKELADDGIRVNAVAPGIVRTDIHAAAGDPERAASRIPIGRAGEPSEIAPAVSWLLSDGARYAAGTVIRVAGGI